MSTFPVGFNMGVADKKTNMQRETIGKPDGPKIFVSEFGFEVGTFTNPRTDMYKKKSPIKATIMHHIPFDKRGYYRPEQTADYNPEEFDYLTDDKGYALCTMDKRDGTACTLRATHMSWKCAPHGGALHPLDKVPSDERALMPTAAKDGRQSYVDPAIVSRMTRFQKLCQGLISVEDLDDEELARGQCKGADGRFGQTPPRMIPKAIHDQMVQQLFVRANDQLRHDLLGAVKALGVISSGEAFEPADRIKAATVIIDRVMGKTADVVIHKQDKPYEMILTSIAGGSRAESRKARGLDPDTGQPIEVIEGEWTDEPTELDEPGEGGQEPEEEPEGDGNRIWDEAADDLVSDGMESDGVPVQTGEDPDDDVVGDYSDEPVGDSVPGVEVVLPGQAEAEFKEAKTALRERLKKARNQRYANREQGHTGLEIDTPFIIVSKGANKEGEGYFVQIKEQQAPRAKRDQGEWRHRI